MRSRAIFTSILAQSLKENPKGRSPLFFVVNFHGLTIAAASVFFRTVASSGLKSPED